MSPIHGVRYTPDEPHSLATELAESGLDALKADTRMPAGARIIVMVDFPLGGGEWEGGMGADGFGHDLAKIRETVERKANVIAMQQREQRRRSSS